MLTDLQRWYRGVPSRPSTYLVTRRLHRLSGGWSSRLGLGVLSRVPGAVDHRAGRRALPPSDTISRLRASGMATIECPLDGAAIDRIRSFATSAPGRVHRPGGIMRDGTYEEWRSDCASVGIVQHFVCAQPDIQRFMTSPELWELAEHHFGTGAVVHPPQLYWTCATTAALENDDEASLARRFHWDHDGVGGLRFHLYLTDVDEGGGPMEYVRGSHRPRSPLGARPLRHADLGIDESEVLRRIGPERIAPVHGPAGTTFATDSHGLHRGTAPRARDRLFLVMPVQATGFAGYHQRTIRVPLRNEAFAAAVRAGAPQLRLFKESAAAHP